MNTIPIPPEAVNSSEGWHMIVEHAHSQAEKECNEKT
jgi:hypothetical protein